MFGSFRSSDGLRPASETSVPRSRAAVGEPHRASRIVPPSGVERDGPEVVPDSVPGRIVRATARLARVSLLVGFASWVASVGALADEPLVRVDDPGALERPIDVAFDEWGRLWVLHGPAGERRLACAADADGDGALDGFRDVGPSLGDARGFVVGRGYAYVRRGAYLVELALSGGPEPVLGEPQPVFDHLGLPPGDDSRAVVEWTPDGGVLVQDEEHRLWSWRRRDGEPLFLAEVGEPLCSADFDPRGELIARTSGGALLHVLPGRVLRIDAAPAGSSGGLLAADGGAWLLGGGPGQALVARSIAPARSSFEAGDERLRLEAPHAGFCCVDLESGPDGRVWVVDAGVAGESSGGLWCWRSPEGTGTAWPTPARRDDAALVELVRSGAAWEREVAARVLATRDSDELVRVLEDEIRIHCDQPSALRCAWILRSFGLLPDLWRECSDAELLGWCLRWMGEDGRVDTTAILAVNQRQVPARVVIELVEAVRANPTAHRGPVLQVVLLSREVGEDPVACDATASLLAHLLEFDGPNVRRTMSLNRLANYPAMTGVLVALARANEPGAWAALDVVLAGLAEPPDDPSFARGLVRCLEREPFPPIPDRLRARLAALPLGESSESAALSLRLETLLASREEARAAIERMRALGPDHPDVDGEAISALAHWRLPEGLAFLEELSRAARSAELRAAAHEALARELSDGVPEDS